MNNKMPNVATIARTILLILTLINQILTSFGHSPIPIQDDQVQEFVSISITIIVTVIIWWKNNSFTKSAKLGDKVMHEQESKDK